METPTGSASGGVKIAVVGMAVNVPGATSLSQFWDIVMSRKETITRFEGATGDEFLGRGTHRVSAFGALPGADKFDAEFFGFTPREAEVLDPQHRIFLETAWRALEDSGVDPDRFPGRIGVFGGVGLNSYLIRNLLSRPELVEAVGPWSVSLGNDKDFVPSRVAYKLDLQGPAVSINTACSTSLVATIFGVQSLLSYQSDLALCGGCSIHLPQDEGYLFHAGGILSPDGRCKPFDKEAQGTFDANGAVIVALRRLADAIAAGDRIYSVISGFGLNNDGALKAGFTAPSVEGQAEVIQDALSMAQKAPDDVAFVEAHGTGTTLGDEIELKALQQVFQSVETSSARYIGSLKSNFGHLDTAAGAAGMVKASLALVHGTVPPTASVTDPVDALKSNSPPFCLNKEPVPFPVSPTGTRCAGVSSFGIGGTNAHVILEQAPSKGDLIATRPGLIVPFSAPDEQRFELLCSEVQECIARDPAERAQLAYTMQIGRRQFSHRGYWVSSSGGSGDIVIRRGSQGGIVPQAEAPPVVFMFGGRDTLDPIALKGLFDGEPEFRREFLDAITHIECLKLEEPGLAEGLRALRQGLPGEWGGTALFCAEYAICKMWQRWGVEPAVLLGVSLGEFVAGVIAGTITFSEALRAVIRSDGLSTAYPMGQSAAVASGEERLRGRLPAGVHLAVSASVNQSILSGESEAIHKFVEELYAEGIAVRESIADAPFHSPLMRPWVDRLIEGLDPFQASPPSIPYVSCVTGTWVRLSDLQDPEHYRKLFESEAKVCSSFDAIGRWIGSKPVILIEVGLGSSLTSFARQARAISGASTVYSTTPESWTLREDFKTEQICEHLLTSLGGLWSEGVGVDWDAFARAETLQKIGVPEQPMIRQSFWVSPDERSNGPDRPPADAEQLTRLPIDSWFSVPTRKSSGSTGSTPDDLGTVVLLGSGPLYDILADALVASNVSWRSAAHLMDSSLLSDERLFDLFSEEHWTMIFESLAREEEAPTHLVLCYESRYLNAEASTYSRAIEPLIHLGRQVGKRYFSEHISIAVIAPKGRKSQNPSAGRASILGGPVRVIPQEFRNLHAGLIEVVVSESNPKLNAQLGALILNDICSIRGSQWITRDGRARSQESFESIALPNPGARPRLLRDNGVYLITGGLGRIGVTLGAHLAEKFGARIGLISRGRKTSPGFDKLRADIRERMLVLNASAEDEEGMRAACDLLETRFGPINGIIHAAGLIGSESFHTLSEASMSDHLDQLRGKVGGLPVIERLIEGRSMDFVVLCSSLSPVLGGLGFSSYASANAVLDEYAGDRSTELNPRWICINWEGWRDEVSATEAPASGASQANELTDEEGIEVFNRIMDQPDLCRVLVSTTDLGERVHRWVDAASTTSTPEVITRQYDRPAHLGPIEPPTTFTERQLIRLWEGLLGITPIGITDNFFEIGGNSLILTQFIASARLEFSVDLPLASLFGRPEIKPIAELIDSLSVREQGVI